MRQWRVGSFSMGLLLVLLGVGLILDRAKGSDSSLQMVIDWWPVILILLGSEVLVAGFLSRNEQFRIKYDIWSILLVITFFFFSLGSYALTCSGVLPRIQEALVSRAHSVSLPEQEITLDGVKKVVLSYSDGNLELRSTTGSSIHVFGEALLYAVDEAEATRLAGMGEADYHVAGDTLFIQVRQLPERYDFFRQDIAKVSRTILVPDNVALEVRGSGRFNEMMHLVLESLAAPWFLSINSPVKATLASGLDVTVDCYTDRRDGLTGNVKWEPTDEDDQIPQSGSSGTLILGQGRWPLYISASHGIEVNIR